jgi:hypothetical protein
MKRRFVVVPIIAVAVLAWSPAFGQTEEEIADQNHVDAPIPAVPPLGGGVQCAPGNVPVMVYSSDFEADDGGWTGSGFGEWQWGALVTGVWEGCDTVPEEEPAGAFSGANVQATNLDGCYQNSGATSTLSQTFDFTDVMPPILLRGAHFHNVFGAFDTIDLQVNGDVLFEDTSANPTADWTGLVVNLDAYAGLAAVTLDFNLNVTTVVNRTGWYLDDLEIEGCEVAIPVGLQSVEVE